MPETEAGIVSTAAATALLLMDTPAELDALRRAGWIKPEGPDRWRLVPLVQGFARWARFTATTATTAQLAACWSVTKVRVAQLAGEGWFKPIAGHRGVYDWAEANSGIVRYLRDDGRRTSRSTAEAHAREVKTREVELRIALRAGELMEHAEHIEILDELLGLVQSELAGLPARLSRDMRERQRIEQAVDAILERLSARAAERSRQLAASFAGAQASATHDAGSMGG
jgi:hypothetical protein